APALQCMFCRGIAAYADGSVQSCDRRDLNDVPGTLPPHDRKHGLGHCDCAEKVGFELQAQFFHLDVLDEAADGEAGIVDEHIDASVFVDHGIYKRGHGIEVRHIEGANVDPVRDLGGGCR